MNEKERWEWFLAGLQGPTAEERREAHQQASRDYHWRHRERRLETGRLWRAAHPEYQREYRERRKRG